MAGHQVRLEKAVVEAVHRHKTAFGFAPDAPDGVVVSVLAREGIEARLQARRRQEREDLYASWAQEPALRAGVGDAMREAIEDGIA